MNVYNITTVRGDVCRRTIDFGSAPLLEGKTITAQVRNRDGDLVGMFDTTVNGAVLVIEWTPEEAGTFSYDVQVGDTTRLSGTIRVTNDVSRP